MGLRRSRLVRVLVAIALVALAAVGLRLSETDEDFEVVRGVVGTPVSLADGTVTAADVRVATALSREGQVFLETPGLFLVVNVEVAATGPRELPSYNARLLAGSRRYDALSGPTVGSVSPGFAATADVVFEVDPAVLTDVTMELAPAGILTAYAEHARIHLGITADNAEAWRAAGRGQVIGTREQTNRGI
jgi:hypothetical protein